MKTSLQYKLILADDHILLRDALASLINNFEEFAVIATAGNGLEVIQLMEKGYNPDIVLMDLNMPKKDGYEAAKWLAKYHPEIKIVILTMYDSEIALIRLLQAGVNGFLKKDIHPSELKNALLTIAAGEYYYSNHTTVKIASLFRKNATSHSALVKAMLTDTEIEFLKLASTEMTYKEIAHVMHMTPRHIDSYRDSLFTKLDVKSRVGLAIYAVKNGLVTF
ncbi:MAG TPA: response regulator transcription factor [Ferruginibacter sp.]|nr:response regulator transcription factor [Ferruginibacter sp.]